MTQDDELEALLDGVWSRRRTELLERVAQLRVCLDQAGSDPAAWQEAGAEAHRLTGALGSLGFDELARRARAVERLVTADPARGDVVAARAEVEVLGARLAAAEERPR